MNDNIKTDGVRASIEFQSLITSQLNKGMDPSAIAFSVLAIGAGMIVKHFDTPKSKAIVDAMMSEALDGKIDLYPALLVANENQDP